MDTFMIGFWTFKLVPQTMICLPVVNAFLRYYWSHQMAPLVIFFLVFLAIAKNKRLHHFVRFNAMQAMMLDIVIMLPTVVTGYIPGEIFWSPIGQVFISFCFMTMFVALLYSVLFALAGRYADIPFVSDAVYLQVYQLEFMQSELRVRYDRPQKRSLNVNPNRSKSVGKLFAKTTRPLLHTRSR
eukprot:TRINITY_DN8337_c0_g1_i1.p1 TRINITY_DN8337_c0_g1~~TRINITY_DN8337_c0_g1_i1.p1  ORF type:complete len:184 (+),score=4.61 TRINITY_DN8337_c0_g1_i1:1-552(+)